jgi:hypothetical protein
MFDVVAFDVLTFDGGYTLPAAPDLREALTRYLRADAALTALVASGQIRCGWRAHRDPLPGLTIAVVSGPRAHDLVEPTGVARSRVQLDVWASTLPQAESIKRRLETLLDGYAGFLGGLRVAECRQIGESDHHVWPGDGNAKPLSRIAVDYLVRHTRGS